MNALRRIFAITRKEILILFARPLERRIIVLPPVILMFVFSWAATREVRNVEVAVLDRDHGAWSLEVRQRLEGSPTFRSVREAANMREATRALDMQRVLLILAVCGRFFPPCRVGAAGRDPDSAGRPPGQRRPGGAHLRDGHSGRRGANYAPSRRTGGAGSAPSTRGGNQLVQPQSGIYLVLFTQSYRTDQHDDGLCHHRSQRGARTRAGYL